MMSLSAALLALSLAADPEVTDVSVEVNDGQSWSVVTGRTVGTGRNLLSGGMGWPGIDVSYLHGLSDKVDIGARFTFNYGIEGRVAGITPGIKPQFLLKVKLLDRQKINLGLNIAPGPLFYFPAGFSRLGFVMPIGLQLGIIPNSAVHIGLSVDLPMYLSFLVYPNGATATGIFAVPILMGAGVEYFVTSDFLIYGQVKMGPEIATIGGAVFSIEGKFGVGWRF